MNDERIVELAREGVRNAAELAEEDARRENLKKERDALQRRLDEVARELEKGDWGMRDRWAPFSELLDELISEANENLKRKAEVDDE